MSTPPESDIEPVLPAPKKGAWKFVYAAFAFVAITGLTLSIVYRQMPKNTSAIDKQRKKNAQRVAYTIVFSSVDANKANIVAETVIRDVGKDSLTTDLVLGSSVTDPWCANIGEYRSMIIKALTQSKQTALGKQSLIVSMVTGLVTKSSLPATLYVCGSLNADSLGAIRTRTEATAQAMNLHASLTQPVRVVNLLDDPTRPIHQEYMNIFRSAGIRVVEAADITSQ
jgi:hypothetical protein